MDKNKTYTTYTCPGCNTAKTISLWRLGRKKTEFCKNCVTTGTQSGVRRPQFSGTASGRWKGGEYTSSDGYKLVKTEEVHASGRLKYKGEHLVIYENHIGRPLKTQKGKMGEQVHHIDGDKLNNDINNLVLCSDTREHRNLHCQLEEEAFKLVRSGHIKFDTETKKYYINESRTA